MLYKKRNYDVQLKNSCRFCTHIIMSLLKPRKHQAVCQQQLNFLSDFVEDPKRWQVKVLSTAVYSQGDTLMAIPVFRQMTFWIDKKIIIY